MRTVLLNFEKSVQLTQLVGHNLKCKINRFEQRVPDWTGNLGPAWRFQIESVACNFWMCKSEGLVNLLAQVQ